MCGFFIIKHGGFLLFVFFASTYTEMLEVSFVDDSWRMEYVL